MKYKISIKLIGFPECETNGFAESKSMLEKIIVNACFTTLNKLTKPQYIGGGKYKIIDDKGHYYGIVYTEKFK